MSSDTAAETTSETDGLSAGWIFCCCAAVTLQLFRMSMDTIQTASQKTSKDFTEEHHDSSNSNSNSNSNNDNDNDKANKASSVSVSSSSSSPSPYGSIASTTAATVTGTVTGTDTVTVTVTGTVSGTPETQALLSSKNDNETVTPTTTTTSTTTTTTTRNELFELIPSRNKASVWSLRVQLLLALLLLLVNLVVWKDDDTNKTNVMVLPVGAVWACILVVTLGALLTVRDLERQRLGIISRTLYLAAALTIWFPIAWHYFSHSHQETQGGDEVVMNVVGLYFLLALVESCFVDWPGEEDQDQDQDQVGGVNHNNNNNNKRRKKTLSRAATLTLLKPYFWPDETSDSATNNRIRAVLTWVCVILSKICNLIAPIFLGWAATALAHQDYYKCIWYSISYAGIQFFGSTFKEGQSLMYLKVAQAAFVQLSETVFCHLHSLSLDWHLRKKLGEVIRSMDRGIAACDTLMKYLFLWLVPALVECIVVCIIFATYFQFLPLAVSVFYFVWIYIVWTILVTLWRKKYRKAVVQSDNEWHDRCTDSLINFETVKYFTAEDYEHSRFGESVEKYQAGSVQVQASLSFLNISQKLILQLCLATALSLSALGIKKRVDCCTDSPTLGGGGCDSGISDCCQAIDNATCPGMQVGDFVAVLTYTIQLFAPLNFLGSVYNAIVMALIDLNNLSELLAEDPDVVDAPDALPLSPTTTIITTTTTTTNSNNDNDSEDPSNIAIEFDNVVFHYPTQPKTKGLKGVSFKCKRGTTTAIVGPTGAGKTTISRLFFRFYDVNGGAVKVNGQDVRTVTQKSLRGAIGVVPQSTSMFNDTLRANLRYGRRDATQEEIEQAAQDAQLLGFVESMDDGWDTVVGDRGMKLSGGEQQRAAIARCLLKDPPFVLLDEATSALDTLTENSVQEALDRLGSHRTVLVIAHRLGTIRNADNILVLKDGVVAEEGNHDELLELNGTYAEMWNMQLHSNTSSSRDSLTALNDDK